MSPRAAWRLEAAGFGPVYDYAAGKSDWIAADLPFEGTARLAGLFTCRGVATVTERTPAGEALRLLDAQGFGPAVVLNQADAEWGRPPLHVAAGNGRLASVRRLLGHGADPTSATRYTTVPRWRTASPGTATTTARATRRSRPSSGPSPGSRTPARSHPVRTWSGVLSS